MQKRFPGCHLVAARTARGSWDYCSKTDTRIEEPISFGICPAAPNKLGECAKKNKEIIAYGVVKAIDEGYCRILDAKRLQQSVDLYNTLSNEAKRIDGVLINEWHWGPPGTGKSSYAFNNHTTHYLKANNKWWDGYNGEEVVIIDDLAAD